MIFRGPHPDVSAPNINVAEFVLGDISAHKNKTAIIQSETKRKISYQELSESIDQMAAGLQINGFKKGDVLAIYSPNLPEYVVVKTQGEDHSRLFTISCKIATIESAAEATASSRRKAEQLVAEELLKQLELKKLENK